MVGWSVTSFHLTTCSIPNRISSLGETMFKDSDFKVSSYSDPGGIIKICVAVAIKPEGVAVRNSNDPQKNTVYFSRDEWVAFVKGVQNGEFNA